MFDVADRDRSFKESVALPAPVAVPMRRGRSVRRGWFRLAAVVVGLSVIPLAEIICALGGWGAPHLRDDPFVGFADVQPLFVLSDDGQHYSVSPSRRNFFAAESFSAQKSESERRVFCIGGSTVQGRPWSVSTAFSTWLELGLNAIDGDHHWDSINCGGISYASYRLGPIMDEVLRYEPDLIILCTGHNEFLEDRTYSDVSRSSALHKVSQFRVVNLARDLFDRFRGMVSFENDAVGRTILKADAEPILDYNDGLVAYHRNDEWRAGVITHFEANVLRMVQRCQWEGVPILLMAPCSNLADCPPFKSEHRADLSTDELRRWESLVDRSQEANHDDARRLLDAAIAIDPQYALTHYQRGRLRTKPFVEDADEFLVAARDLDVCPLRMVTELEECLRLIADESDVPLIEMTPILLAGGRTKRSILGDEALVDHIHPKIEGQQQIAEALLSRMADEGRISLPENWREAARSAFGSYFASLDSAYFLRGQRNLEGLRAWSQGRADGPPAADRYPVRIGQP